MRSCSIWSLYVGTRSSQPSGVIIEKYSASSACWGTRDCRKIVALLGVEPDGEPVEDGLARVGGERRVSA